MTIGSSLADLARARQGRRRRASSWDRTGGNADFVGIGTGQTVVLCDLEGAGIVHRLLVPDGAPRTLPADAARGEAPAPSRRGDGRPMRGSVL